MPRCRAKIIIGECDIAKLLKRHPLYCSMLPPGNFANQRGVIGRCRAAYTFGERPKLGHFDKNARCLKKYVSARGPHRPGARARAPSAPWLIRH